MVCKFITLNGGKQVKLGRIRPKGFIDGNKFRVIVLADGRLKVAPFLHTYYDREKDASPPPTSVDWATKAMPALNRMYRNDVEGCCVISGKYHQVGLWTGNESGTPVQGTDAEVDASYVGICGPGDQGCVITDVLDVFKSKGLTLAGKQHIIGGYVAVDWTNRSMVQVAIDLFGSVGNHARLTPASFAQIS